MDDATLSRRAGLLKFIYSEGGNAMREALGQSLDDHTHLADDLAALVAADLLYEFAGEYSVTDRSFDAMDAAAEAAARALVDP